MITIFSKSKSPFGNTVQQRILIESSDIVDTSFAIKESDSSATTPDFELTKGDKNLISTKYRNDLKGYLNYLKSNLSKPGSINVLHFNLYNVVNDYNNVMIKDQYFPNLGSISCTDESWREGGFYETETTIRVSPTPDVSYTVELQPGSYLGIVLSTFIDYGFYNKPTIYQYVYDDPFSGSCPENVTSCGDNNIILGSKCSGCDLHLVVNGIAPLGVDLPYLQVHNGVTLSTSPDFIDNNGISCYLIKNLFDNNVTITYPKVWTYPYRDFMNNIRSGFNIPKGNNYLTRVDAVPGSYEYVVLYYTTLDPNNNSYTYVSDSAIIFNRSDAYGPFTINDGNKFSNRHIKLTGGNCKGTYQCGSTKSINFGLDIILPNGTVSSIGGKDGELQDIDFGYLYAFAYIPNCQINFHIKGDDSNWWPNYRSGTETFPLNNCLTKNLSIINLFYQYNEGGGEYMEAYADLYDTSGNKIVTKSSASNSRSESGC